MSDSAHGERVIADDPPAATHNVGGGGPSPSRGSSGVAQPVVQRRDAALKLGQFVGVVDSATLRTESAFNAPGSSSASWHNDVRRACREMPVLRGKEVSDAVGLLGRRAAWGDSTGRAQTRVRVRS